MPRQALAGAREGLNKQTMNGLPVHIAQDLISLIIERGRRIWIKKNPTEEVSKDEFVQ